MECTKVKKLLSEYIDQTLDFKTNEIIKEHISLCKICSEELSALEKCIRNVSSLKQAQAPEDFLQRVHERIERRFEFERIMRKLFVPTKVKIPLEFAGVLATVVLVIMVYRVIQPLGPTEPTPVLIGPEKLFEKSERVPVALSREAILPDTPRTFGITKDLYMNKGMAIEGMVPPRNVLSIANGLPANAAGQVSFGARGGFESGTQSLSRGISQYSFENAIVYPHKEDYNREFSKIKNIIESLGGIVIFAKFKKETNLLESINVRMPSKNYSALLDKLKEIGISEESLVSVITKDKESMELSIKLIPSK